jgi:regulator of ribonuclease activity A
VSQRSGASRQIAEFESGRSGTVDLADELAGGSAAGARSCQLPLQSFGGRARFHGRVRTVRCVDDHQLIKRMLAEPGDGQVLVVDGAGSLRTALLGDQMAATAVSHGWSGLVIHGAVRDVDALRTMDLGIRAVGACPLRSENQAVGQLDVPVTFGGVTFEVGGHVWCDSDGVLLTS